MEILKIEKFRNIFHLLDINKIQIESDEESYNYNIFRDCDSTDRIFIKFKEQFCIKGSVNRDFSGYGGFKIIAETTVGQLELTVKDCFGNIWKQNKNCSFGKNELFFDFKSFVGYSDNNLINLNELASVESFELKFSATRADEQKENNLFILQLLTVAYSRGLAGPTMSVDPLFDFYNQKTWKETASLLKSCGITNASVIFTKEFPIEKHLEIVNAFHEEGLKCSIRINPPTDFEAFEAHPEWHQKMLDGCSRFDWRVHLCPNKEDFVIYYCKKIANILQNVPYDCLQISELWFEVWGGAYKKNLNRGKYACLCDKCLTKFKNLTGFNAELLFNEDSEYYFELPQNGKLYKQWVDFRVNTISCFCREIVRSAKEVHPDLSIAYMYLSDCTVELDKVREYQAQDFEECIKASNPDILIIQDAWQDWLREDLSPEFAKLYCEAYIDRAKKIKSDLIIQIHADIGSVPKMKRSIKWMNQFSAYVRANGGDSPMYYEFTLNQDMY